MKPVIVTYLLTYGGAVASLYNPFYGLLVYVCFAIIKPESMWFWAVEPGNYSRIVAIALLVGWAVRGFGSWQFGRGKPVVYSLLGFWVWTMVSASLAEDQETAWACVENLSKMVLPFLVGITTLDSPRKLRLLAWTILLSQGFAALEFNRSYLEGFNRLKEIGFGGFDNNCLAIGMCACVGLGFFLGVDAPNLPLKGLALGSVALVVHAIQLSFSRGGMLGLIFVAIVSFILIPKRPRHYLVLAAGVLIALYLTGPQLRERFLTVFSKREELDSSAVSRLELWGRCIDTMLRDPLVGVGPFHWHLIVTKRYNWPVAQEAHSLWLQTGAEYGIPGITFLVLFYATSGGGCAVALQQLQRNSPRKMPALDVPLARGVIAGLVGFAVSAQFVSVQFLEIPIYVALVGAGVLKLGKPPEKGADNGAPSVWRRVQPAAGPPRPPARPTAVVGAAAGSAVAAAQQDSGAGPRA